MRLRKCSGRGYEKAQRDLLENSEEVEERLRAGVGKAQKRLKKCSEEVEKRLRGS